MKVFAVASLLFAALVPQGRAAAANPIQKVLELISNLEAKVTAEGEQSKKVYEEFVAWCEDRAANLGFEIKTGEAQVADLQATIDQETALGAALTSKVQELSESIAKADADLKEATAIREKEAADFLATEKDLIEIMDMLKRAITVLEREMNKGGASMLQLKRANNLVDALGAMVQASVLSTRDVQKLTALVQQRTEDTDGDLTLGAPEVAAYESKSGSIVKTLEDMLDQAEGQLEAARKTETTSRHSFEKLKQGLEDEIKFNNKELQEAQSGIALSGEKKSTAEGDLAATSKDLEEDKVALEDVHHDCLTKAEDYEAETKSRAEELKALAEAKRVIQETTGGAGDIAYGLNQVSFLQIRRASVAAKSGNVRAERLVRDLAEKHHSTQLAQLAARIASASTVRVAAGQDPFAKVKGLISDMIAKLEDESSADASHKAYCDKELAEAESKHADKSVKEEKLATQIDQMTARTAQLKEEVATLQNELAALASTQAQMDKLRQEEHEIFVAQKADMEQGIKGVQAALKTLKDYYGKSDKAHNAGDDESTGIIGLLEVVESDLSKGVAEIIATEQSAVRSYKQNTKDNEIEKAAKEQDVKHKTAEAANLDKSLADATSDHATLQTELDAVNEYLEKLHEECDAKAEPYEERAARRQAEIAGLKEAMELLSEDAVLLQKSTQRRALRGHA